MKKSVVLFFAVLSLAACKKSSSDTPVNPYSNKLTLGTGISTTNAFDLIGVGTTFSASSSIYFRLECADDMGSSSVTITIDKADGTPYQTFSYESLQSYGHIYVSAFNVKDPGSYKATGTLLTGNKTIASQSFTVN